MKTAVRYRLSLLLIVLAAALAIILLLVFLRRAAVDPHEGQVYINDGFGMVWMTPLEGVEASVLTPEDFTILDGHPRYNGTDYRTLRGIDVSEHQHEVDWQRAAPSLDFAFIRLGRRGYTEGGLFEDPYYRDNMRGALDQGLKVGVYFFSQAVNVQEAIEEARFVLDRVGDYEITLPIVYDWEKIDAPDARTLGLDSGILNDCAVAFCETIRMAGYEPCVYFNRHLGYYGFDLSRLTDYTFWVAVPGDFPDFYYACELWQYSFTASVPGVEGGTDMNLLFLPVSEGDDGADTSA